MQTTFKESDWVRLPAENEFLGQITTVYQDGTVDVQTNDGVKTFDVELLEKCDRDGRPL
ncbi:MAG: hypothetical protein K0S09_96 [Sphingobacteriaceae bacterium]|jgi:hypothetical protein|nr:hypothetical protein [Sphingobacteriaceae bacterium]